MFSPAFGVQFDLNQIEYFLVVGSPQEPLPWGSSVKRVGTVAIAVHLLRSMA